MANPPCQSDDGNAAIFTGTNFDTGDSVMLCPVCMVTFCATIIEGLTGLPVPQILDDLHAGEPDDDDATDDTTPDATTPDEDSTPTADDATADEDSAQSVNS